MMEFAYRVQQVAREVPVFAAVRRTFADPDLNAARQPPASLPGPAAAAGACVLWSAVLHISLGKRLQLARRSPTGSQIDCTASTNSGGDPRSSVVAA